MANTLSAKKNIKKNKYRAQINLARRTALKTAVKKVRDAVAKQQDATLLLKDVAAKLSRAKSKGTIHANTAARKLSRLAKLVNKTA